MTHIADTAQLYYVLLNTVPRARASAARSPLPRARASAQKPFLHSFPGGEGRSEGDRMGSQDCERVVTLDRSKDVLPSPLPTWLSLSPLA